MARGADDWGEPSDLVAPEQASAYPTETLRALADCRTLWVRDADRPPPWFADRFGVVSGPQAHLNPVNDAIAVREGITRAGHRPRGYGRAALVVASDPARGGELACFDVKGVGVGEGRTPRPDVHHTGTLPLNKAIEELVRERLVTRALGLLKLDVACLPTLAVLLTGYRSRDRRKNALPAAIIVREARHRAEKNVEIDPFGSERSVFRVLIELYLRGLGISSSAAGTKYRVWREEGGAIRAQRARDVPDTSDDPTRTSFFEEFERVFGLPFEGDLPNVQTTRDIGVDPLFGTLVDFGQYGSYDGPFDRPLVVPASDRPFWIGNVLRPGGRDWVDPDPELRFRASETPVPVPDTVTSWVGLAIHALPQIKVVALALARLVDAGRLDGAGLERAIATYVDWLARSRGTRWGDVGEHLELTSSSIRAGRRLGERALTDAGHCGHPPADFVSRPNTQGERPC